jgi:dUTP pyrophosphatase
MSEVVRVKVFKETDNELPCYAHDGDSGIDLRVDMKETVKNHLKGIGYDWLIYKANEPCFDEQGKLKIARVGMSDCSEYVMICIRAGGTALIGTGLRMAIPIGYELQVRTRSGFSLRGIVCANSPGTIDSGYRGDIGVIVHNQGKNDVYLYAGDKIAQGVLCKVERIGWEVVNNADELDASDRGEGGFGSTGI